MLRVLVPEFRKIFIILDPTGKLSTSYSDKFIKSVCESQFVETPVPPVNFLVLNQPEFHSMGITFKDIHWKEMVSYRNSHS